MRIAFKAFEKLVAWAPRPRLYSKFRVGEVPTPRFSKHSFSVSLVFLISLFIAASSIADTPSTQSTTGTISGIVVDAQGNPVEKCIVVAQQAGEKMRDAFDTTTDKKGKFTIKNVPEGSYNLIARTSDLKSKAVETIDVFADQNTDAGKLKLKSK